MEDSISAENRANPAAPEYEKPFNFDASSGCACNYGPIVLNEFVPNVKPINLSQTVVVSRLTR